MIMFTKAQCGWLTSLLLLGAGSLGAQAPKLRLAEAESVRPEGYEAQLWLDPAKTTFHGVISIRMEIEKPLATLWLNQNNLQIESAEFKTAAKMLQSEVVDGGEDFVGLRAGSELGTGEASVEIHYHGKVQDKSPTGVFQREDLGNKYLFTQFEAADARSAFPCFDEPEFKTPWKLTLVIPSDDSAVSNTLVAKEEATAEGKKVEFRQTKPLPSYLVAFGVGPFEYVDAGIVERSKAPVRIVVPKGRSAQAKYAAEVTAEILTRHEHYFGIPFPYEKSDQVSVPDFPGAMENPGMVTYGQSIILADPKNDSIRRQRGYASVAAHELAHQWFGDLVTTAWWNDIWLNEAFATWMERKLISQWKPEWKTDVEDVQANMGAAEEDSLLSARKIRQEIVTKSDIGNAFDGITYQKGAAVIGMFENWMGAEEFRKGVQFYLKRYAYKATTAGDFLDALSSASGKDVTKPFSSFLNQSGIPVVSVNLRCGESATLEVEQKRFVPLGSKAPAGQVWEIPLCVRYGAGGSNSGEKQCTLITKPRESVRLSHAQGCPAWVQANDEAHGYYYVDYSAPLLEAIDGIAKTLPATERVSVIANAAALSKAGKLSAGDSLKLVETFHADSEPAVLSSAVGLAFAPMEHLVPPSLTANYHRFLVANFGARARELGWIAKPGDSDDTRLLRRAIVRPMATWGGDEQLAAEARSLADKWLADKHSLDANIAGPVLSTAAFYGDAALFDRFLKELQSVKDEQVRGALVQGLHSFRDRAAIEKGMQAELNGDVAPVEGFGLLFGGAGQDATRKMGFEFVKAHYDEIMAKFSSGGSAFDFLGSLPFVGGSFCDTQSRDELKAFFEPREGKLPGAERSLAQATEQIDLCIANKAAQEASVAQFLAKY